MITLSRVVYASRAVGRTDIYSLVEIVGASSALNRRDRLTGALLCHGDRFLQAVEGAENDLNRLMTRLEADRRHADMRVLYRGPAERRLFPDQPMTLIQPDEALTLRLRALNLDALDAAAVLDLLADAAPAADAAA